jgi:hypothetical protein
MPIGNVFAIVYHLLCSTVYGIFVFLRWFYLDFLPFIIQYIAIPLFILGLLMAVAFAGGTLLITIVFFVFLYFFIKYTIFVS